MSDTPAVASSSHPRKSRALISGIDVWCQHDKLVPLDDIGVTS
ncbi:hypothetical protein [Ruficoccus amylovorans]|nr:hypothetical protein [Ruficoccus amylovorans]